MVLCLSSGVQLFSQTEPSKSLGYKQAAQSSASTHHLQGNAGRCMRTSSVISDAMKVDRKNGAKSSWSIIMRSTAPAGSHGHAPPLEGVHASVDSLLSSVCPQAQTWHGHVLTPLPGKLKRVMGAQRQTDHAHCRTAAAGGGHDSAQRLVPVVQRRAHQHKALRSAISMHDLTCTGPFFRTRGKLAQHQSSPGS